MSSRISRVIEYPSLTFQDPFQLKQLDGGEIWIDQLIGTCLFVAEYRPDQSACFSFWHAWEVCAARDCHEDPSALLPCVDYPQQLYCPAFKATMNLPVPPVNCEQASGRPSNQGYSFQLRLKIKGWSRVRGVLLYATAREQSTYGDIVC